MGALSNLTERVRRAALSALGAERALTAPVYRYATTRQGITGTSNQPNPSRLLTDGFAGVQATAARAIAGRLSDLDFEVQNRVRGDDGAFTWEADPLHPLLNILERPNQFLSRRQMLKLTSTWLTQTGEAYWLIVTNGAGATRELWPMSPQHIEKISSDALPISGYVFHGESGETRYGLDEVVHFFDPDPDDPFRGVGIVGPQAREFDAQTFASDTLRSHFQHDAIPKVVLTAKDDADVADSNQREAFWSDWQNRYNKRGGENQGVPAFLPNGYGVHELGGLSDIDSVKAYLEFGRDTLLMANGVPRSILGDVVDANRAAADTNRLVFDRHTVKPLTGIIADALTAQMAVIEFGRDTRVRFEQFIDEDADLRLREERQDLETGVRSVNQIRADRGQDAVEWGDRPRVTFGAMPYEPDDLEFDDDPDPMPAPVEDEDEEPARGRESLHPRIHSRFTAEAMWSRLMQAEAEYVPKMTRAVRQAFAGQKRLALEALRSVDNVAEETARAQHSRGDWIDELFEGFEFARLFDTIVTPISLDAYTKAGQNVLADLEVTPTLSFDQAAIKAVDAQGADLVSKVNATTKKRLRRALAKGIAEGESEEQLASRVRRTFNQASKSRARTIARTEVGWATSTGQLAGYHDSNIVTLKRWNTALDGDVRDTHEIDGQTVRVDEAFTLGDGEQAQAPRVSADGGRLSAHNGINCRCFSTPIIEGV